MKGSRRSDPFPMVDEPLFPSTGSFKRFPSLRRESARGPMKRGCLPIFKARNRCRGSLLGDRTRGYSSDEARAEAGRCFQCECMECVKICEYLAHYKGYPKKYIRQIYNNLSIVMGQRHGNTFINSCSLCGLCKEVCPESLHMGEVCKAARAVMVNQGKMPPSAHEFALEDMTFSNSDKAALARHQPGTASSASLFFPGCQLAGSSPDHVVKTYEYLTHRLEGGVGLMLGCCGAPADWGGEVDAFSQVLNQFRNQWLNMGSPQLILACSSCYAVFKAHLPEARVVSLWEVMDRIGCPIRKCPATTRGLWRYTIRAPAGMRPESSKVCEGWFVDSDMKSRNWILVKRKRNVVDLAG